MKINLISLFIIILLYNLKENDICGGNGRQCSFDTSCHKNSSLSSLRCTKYLKRGDNCACFGNLPCRKGVCTKEQLIGIGSKCWNTDRVCHFNQGLSVTSCHGKCYHSSYYPPEINKIDYSDELGKCAYDYNKCPICLDENDICDTLFVYDKCIGGTTCYYNGTLSGPSKCLKYSNEGDECDPKQNDRCPLGTQCLPDNKNVNRCLDYHFSGIGDDCELNSDCATDQLVCIKGECQLPSNQNCQSSDGNCQYDEYCACSNMGTICQCQKIKLEGQSCYDNDECFGSLVCKNGICSKIKLIELGGDCSSNICNFNKGLFCSKNICQEFIPPSSKSCNPNSTFNECSDDQSCSCSEKKCYQSEFYPTEYYKNYYSDELRTCAYNNECLMKVNKVSRNSCLSKHCRKEICSYYAGDELTEKSNDCGSSEYIKEKYCSFSSKITKSIISLFIVLSFVLVIIF
ncbi:hypothetical protein ACTA71_008086 [Dictyostelium dimigraforme]